MENRKIPNTTYQKQQDIPKPTETFIMHIFMFIGFSFAGCFIIYAAFFGQLNEDFYAILFLTIFGLIFLIPGIIFLFKVLKQIKLRLNWNEQKNVDIKEEKLTTNEANMYQFMSMAHDSDYHIESMDKALGVKYEPKLKKDKYGNTYFKSKTRYGGFYYLGSLLGSIIFTITIIASIINMIDFIKNRDYINIVTFLIIVLPFSVIMDIHFIKDLIIEVKEKLNVKKLIKEGKMQKEKMNFGTKLYRIAISLFLLFMGFMLFGLIMQETGYFLSTNLIENLIKVLFISFVTTIGIILIYSICIGIRTIIDFLKNYFN